MSSALAPVAAAPRCASRGTARPRDSAAACISARRADASARPLRARSSPSRARVSWTCAPRAPGRRGSAVPARAGPRFRDETERQRAIDRLSPKLPGTPGAGDAGDGPPPEISRPRDVTRPRRFKDAVRDRVDADVRRKARSDPRELAAGNEDPGSDPRELARRRRAERAEAESADRLEYLVSVIRAELGRPQSLLSVDSTTRDKRFANCFHRLRNFGAVEIAFGLVKYYNQHWDEEANEDEKCEANTSWTAAPNENAFPFRDDDGESANPSERRVSLDDLVNDPSVSDETRERAAWARDVLGGGDESPESANENEESRETHSAAPGASYDDKSADEQTRRRLLRAAQLKAVGVSEDDPRASADYDPEDPEDEKNPSFGDVLDAFASLVRSYFSVDFVEGEDGNKEMVVMTSPEFLGFLLVAIIVSGRIGHWIVQTYLSTPVDPLLR